MMETRIAANTYRPRRRAVERRRNSSGVRDGGSIAAVSPSDRRSASTSPTICGSGRRAPAVQQVATDPHDEHAEHDQTEAREHAVYEAEVLPEVVAEQRDPGGPHHDGRDAEHQEPPIVHPDHPGDER